VDDQGQFIDTIGGTEPVSASGYVMQSSIQMGTPTGNVTISTNNAYSIQFTGPYQGSVSGNNGVQIPKP
jgi:hypothetical protein